MSNGPYIGIDGKARKIKAGYIGVDGVARKIKVGYIGVNGVARPFWAGGAADEGALDGMCSYNGVILPALPERDKAKYPYALIVRGYNIVSCSDDDFKVYFLTEPCTYADGGIISDYIQFASTGDYATATIDRGVVEPAWSDLTEQTGSSKISLGTGSASHPQLVWSNYSVTDSTSGEVLLAASEPRKPGLVKGFRYGTYYAPKLPAWDKAQYPYVLMFYMMFQMNLVLSDEPYAYDAETGAITPPTNKGPWYSAKSGYGDWESHEGVTDQTIFTTEEWINNGVWTSYDVMSSDGTVYFARKEPVPAYD